MQSETYTGMQITYNIFAKIKIAKQWNQYEYSVQYVVKVLYGRCTQNTIQPWHPKASPSPVDTKMAELSNHKAQASLHHACAKDVYLKCPHPPNIDGDIWWDWWLVFCWFWGCQTSDV